jgi:hypothetical protein
MNERRSGYPDRMTSQTHVALKPGLRLLTPAMFVGMGAGLLLAGIATEIWTSSHLVGSVEVLAGIVVGLVANLTNLAAISRARRAR